MVLVLPEFRGRGLATRRVACEHALADLAWRDIAAILDATPDGHPVYVDEGFVDSWGFSPLPARRTSARRRIGCAPQSAAAPPRPAPAGVSAPARDADWPAMPRHRRPAFGADRAALLRSLAARLPRAAQVAERAGRIEGFVLGRDGREAAQIGPLWAADDASVARDCSTPRWRRSTGPVYLDLTDRHARLLPSMRSARGFA